MQTTGAQIVHALRTMGIVKRPDGFQFNDHRSVDHEIGGILPDDNAAVADNDALLLRHRKPARTQVIRERVFINLLEKARPKRVRNGKRTSDNPFRDLVQDWLIGVHQRSSAVPPSLW